MEHAALTRHPEGSFRLLRHYQNLSSGVPQLAGLELPVSGSPARLPTLLYLKAASAESIHEEEAVTRLVAGASVAQSVPERLLHSECKACKANTPSEPRFPRSCKQCNGLPLGLTVPAFYTSINETLLIILGKSKNYRVCVPEPRAIASSRRTTQSPTR